MPIFSPLEQPPTETDVAVWGPIEAYPEYERAIVEAESEWEGITEAYMRGGATLTYSFILSTYYGLRLPRGEDRVGRLGLGDRVRSLGALGMARFLRVLFLNVEAVEEELGVDSSLFGIRMSVKLDEEGDRDVIDYFGLEAPELTKFQMAKRRQSEHFAYMTSRPYSGYPFEFIQSGANPLLPHHPTLVFSARPERDGEPERHEQWFHGAQLLVQRLTEETPLQDQKQRALIVPFADTSKTYWSGVA